MTIPRTHQNILQHIICRIWVCFSNPKHHAWDTSSYGFDFWCNFAANKSYIFITQVINKSIKREENSPLKMKKCSIWSRFLISYIETHKYYFWKYRKVFGEWHFHYIAEKQFSYISEHMFRSLQIKLFLFTFF